MTKDILEKRGRPRKDSTTLFGQWLHTELMKHRMTAINLAQILDVSNSYVSRLTSGYLIPTNVMACACAAVFQADYDRVLQLVCEDRYQKIVKNAAPIVRR